MPNNDIAIKVTNLTKIYHLYDKPQDRLKEALNPFKKSYHHDFYAMNDVSFEIKKGETVGIIGKNGAGKSTLLKMITGVLTPTSGSVEVKGKIASLLELGAGFNPEMTGLENIYLNGTLMGFTHEEIESKVDSILEFADIGDFIHQPVKMYSSGMFARLAFSVAINVKPDILIVDEVLSVGDMRFQQKSIRKMQEMQDNGTTILFVTHDMAVINNFCQHVIWIESGKIITQGDTNSITKNYISSMSYGVEDLAEIKKTDNNKIDKTKKENNRWISSENKESFGDGEAKILAVSMTDKDGVFLDTIYNSVDVNFNIKFETYKDLNNIALGIVVKDRLSNNIFTLNSYMYDTTLKTVTKGSIYKTSFSFIFPYLAEGRYSISVALSEGTQENHIQHHWVHDIYELEYLSLNKTNKIAAILAFDKMNVTIKNEKL